MKLSELLIVNATETAQAAEPQADEPQALPTAAEVFAQVAQRVEAACAVAATELRAMPERARVFVDALAALSASPQS